ncbi:hypothetical protein [Luteimonas saliphila]|uniref:hypothetical protein n=1 Tax=Luteimonas saliphila TaxID=2804919 RepID=UPI00192D3C3C|nr:hypothetical protein [Luteimonas saliphila]
MSPRALVVALGLVLAMPALAQEDDAAGKAVRADAWVSSDAEGNETRKLALGWDVSHRDPDHWWGLKVERARFSGDDWSDSEDRAYLSGAGDLRGWSWQGDIGSNGHDLVGRGSIHSKDARRKEFFIERDVLETRGGVANGWVQTFAGAAIDLPMGDRWSTTVLGGAQDFGTGSNLRTHLRANLVHALVPDQGLSLQLRTRYFHDSDPREADYFSPSWYGEAMGVLGWRRFVGGYQWRAVAGMGRQRSAGEDWKRARMLQFGLETPRRNNAWLRLDAGYSDTPVVADGGADSYSYRYVQVQGVVAF